MLFQCWFTVFDAGPSLKQHWVNALACEQRAYGLLLGGGPKVVVSTAALHARVRGSVPASTLCHGHDVFAGFPIATEPSLLMCCFSKLSYLSKSIFVLHRKSAGQSQQ